MKITKNQLPFYIVASSILLLILWGVPAYATEDDGLLELMSVLRDNGTINQAQYLRVVRAINANESEDKVTVEDSAPQVKTKGGLEIATNDGQFSFKLGGRLMVDAGFYDEQRNKLGDGTELRRARLKAEGRLFGDWEYELGLDFADGDADVKDAYIQYSGFNPTHIKVGQFKEPFSLEEMTSSKYITFMERALVNEFAPGRNIGIAVNTRSEHWTFTTGVFGEAFDDDVKNEGNEGWGVTARTTFAPWKQKRGVLHLGLAATRRWMDSDHEVDFSSRPESHITDVKYLNTDDIDNVVTMDKVGVEMAAVLGSWSLQGEAIHTMLNRNHGSDDVEFSGWYAYGSWFLTGESRAYKFKNGGFGSVKPLHKYGAWELAARYSVLDLNSRSITGGTERNWTIGLNWYINSNMRIMANYTWVNNDSFADDAGDVQGDDDPSIFQTRLQLHF